MNKKNITKDSQTNWERISKMRDKDIDLSDIPEVTEKQIKQAKLRIGGKLLPKQKVRVNISLDANIIAYYKTRAAGRGYQTLINEALKENILYENLESIIRRVVREELRASG